MLGQQAAHDMQQELPFAFQQDAAYSMYNVHTSHSTTPHAPAHSAASFVNDSDDNGVSMPAICTTEQIIRQIIHVLRSLGVSKTIFRDTWQAPNSSSECKMVADCCMRYISNLVQTY